MTDDAPETLAERLARVDDIYARLARVFGTDEENR